MNVYRLGDVCSRLSSGRGIAASEVREAGSYPVVGGNGIRGYADTFNFAGDCAVIGRQGAACGNVRFFSGKAYMTEHAVVACTTADHNVRYLAYLLSTMNLGRLSAQSAQPGLSVKMLAKQLIEMPNLETQNRIVSLLGKLDDATALNRRINDYLARLLAVRYKHLLHESGRTVALNEVVDILSGGTPKTKQPEYWNGGSIPFFAPGDAKDSMYSLTTEKHITEIGLNNCNSDLFPVDTVFLTARGTVGKVSMAGRPMAMNQSCFAFAGKGIPQSVVYQVIKGAVRSLKSKANGATFAAINTRDLKAETVPILDAKTIVEYDDWARSLHRAIRNNEEKTLQLTALRDTVLPKLMSGEIDVSKIERPTQPNNHLCAG